MQQSFRFQAGDRVQYPGFGEGRVARLRTDKRGRTSVYVKFGIMIQFDLDDSRLEVV